MTIERSRVRSPLGVIALSVSERGLCGLDFIDPPRPRLPPPPPEGARPGRLGRPIAARIRAYFAGDLHALDDIPVAPAGTPFQLRVWAALRRIGAGETRSYQELAASIDAPTASRAVGAANGRNPISLVVPCHRVIAADGRLHGYGGGLWRKQWLLQHEGALARELPGLAGDAAGAVPDALIDTRSLA
jgi:methylated-DNA-[protein]-cysteine S-methyltransferase